LKEEKILKLRLTRNHSPRAFGGMNFELFVRAELDDEEAALVRKYGVGSETLMVLPAAVGGEWLTIEGLAAGQRFNAASLGSMLANEQAVRSACQIFEARLHILRRLGLTDTVEYHEAGADRVEPYAADAEDPAA
jgi:hypothetical protein